MSFVIQRRFGAQALRYGSRQSAAATAFSRRNLHEYLVMVNDSKEVRDLGPQVKATFAGEVLSEESSSPRSIFACRAASIEVVEDALVKNGKHDLSAVKIFPLETVHTSTLEQS